MQYGAVLAFAIGWPALSNIFLPSLSNVSVPVLVPIDSLETVVNESKLIEQGP
jgi:hypothetical protein